MVRSTPHPTTKKSPAELLFGRKIKTRLPQTLPIKPLRPDIQEALIAEDKAKQRQKRYKDEKSYVKPHNIKVGDKVLLKQHTTKHTPPYDPNPFTVT